jgi:hypothetical protein
MVVVVVEPVVPVVAELGALTVNCEPAMSRATVFPLRLGSGTRETFPVSDALRVSAASFPVGPYQI